MKLRASERIHFIRKESRTSSRQDKRGDSSQPWRTCTTGNTPQSIGNTKLNEDSCSFSTASVWTHTIHIPVMEKAERLTGRTIQAVIGLVRSWRCPKHGSIQGLQTGDTTGGRGTGKQAGVWGSMTHRETHWGRHERRNKEGVATACLLHRTFNTEQRRLKRKS